MAWPPEAIIRAPKFFNALATASPLGVKPKLRLTVEGIPSLEPGGALPA